MLSRRISGAVLAFGLAVAGGYALGQDGPPGPASGPTEPADAPSIRFTFKDAPMAQVLDLFAREMGLSIVFETQPPDWKVTYFSADEYDLPEALSVLNKILQGPGFVLQRDEQHLYFRKLETAKRSAQLVDPDNLPPSVTPEQLVTVVVPLNNALAKDLAEQLAPLIAKFGQLLPLPTQNALIITETAEQMQQLRAIIERLDARPAYEDSVKVFALEYITPEQAIASLKALVAEKQKTVVIDSKGKRRVIEDQTTPGVKLEPNGSTNSVIAVGPEGRLKTIEQLIDIIDIPDGEGGGRQMATFLLESIDAAEGERVVKSLFQAVPDERKPTLVRLDGVNKLSMVGDGSQITQAAALLSEMDRITVTTGGGDAGPAPSRLTSQTVTMPLEHLEAPAALAALNRLLTPRQQRVLRLAPAPSGGALIAIGPPDELSSLRSLAEAIDAPAKAALDARVIELTGRTSRAAIERATALLDATSPEARVTIELDEEAGVATLVGAKHDVDRFTNLLRTAEGAMRVRRETRTYTIDAIRPSELAGRLGRLARPLLAPADGSPYNAPTFEAADDVDALVVRAEPGQFGVIDRLIETLSEPDAPAMQFQVIQLPAGDPEAVAARAQALFDDLGATLDPSEAGRVSWELDEPSGSLLITADDAGMRRFTNLLNEVQRLTPPARTTELYELQFAEAGRVAVDLAALIEAAPVAEPGRTPPTPVISVAPTGNALIVTGEAQQHTLVREHLRRLDVLEPADLPPLRLLTIRSADVNAVAQMLRDQYSRRSVEDRRLNPVDLRAEPSTNTLIVSARDEDFEEIRAFVEGLNAPESEAERVTEIFPLKVAKAVDVASAMQKLYPDPPMPVDRRGNPLPHLKAPREVNVSADAASNSLIVDAPAERMPAFKALVDKLDRVELPPLAELRTYRIEKADIRIVAQTLNALARQGTLQGAAQPGTPRVPVTVEAEPVSGTLIVAGDARTHQLVEQVLRDLSAAPVERGLRVVRIANADAQDVADRALTIYEQQIAEQRGAQPVDVSVSAATNSLMIVAEDEAMARFLRILDELENQAGPPRELRLIELQHASAGDAALFLTDLLESSRPFNQSGGVDPVFEPIERNNALMIAAQPNQVAIIESLVRSIDVPGDARTEPLRILRLRTAEASNIERVLSQAYASRPAEERAARPVTVRADANTNSLIVSAHPEVLPEIETIVSDLNDAQAYDAEGREIRIFPLKVARAEELALTIDKMYPEPPIPVDARGRPLPHLKQPREVVVRADPQTNALIVDAPAKRMAGFQQLVEQLDRSEVARETALRTYRIARADLDAVVRTLRSLASSGGIEMGAQGPRGAQMVIEAEPVSRTLVVSAPPIAFPQIEAVIQELEGSLAGLETELAFFQLTNARADRVADVMEGLLRAQLTQQLRLDGGPENAADDLLDVVADRATNSLIITAPASMLETAREIVGRLDTGAQAAGRDVVRIVPLVFADAEATAGALQTTLGAAELPTGGDVSVTAAAGSSALVLSGAELDLEYLQGLIGQLDVAPADDAKGVRTVYLEHARAEVVAPLVEQLLKGEEISEWLRYDLARRGRPIDEGPDVRVVAEPRLNAVVITAPREVLATAEEIVSQLDVAAVAADRAVRILTLANADADEVAQNVAAVFGDEADAEAPPVIRVDASSNSLIVRGTPAQLATIEGVVGQLDEAALGGARQLRMVPLDKSRVDAATMAATLERVLGRERGVRVEVISAEQLLERTRRDQAPAGDAPSDDDPPPGTPTGRLDAPTDDSAAIEQARRKIFVPKRMRLIIGFNGLALAQAGGADAAPADRAPDVTIAVDPVTNSLILLGSARATDRIAELAATLERQMPASPGRIRIVELPEGADADYVARLVNATIQQMGRSSQNNPGGLTGRVGVIADGQGGALIVSANDADFDAVAGVIGAVAVGGAAGEVTVKVYQLQTVLGWRAAQAVNDFASPAPRGRQAQRMRAGDAITVTVIGADGRARQASLPAGAVRASRGASDQSLIVTAPPEAIPIVDRFIEMLDQSVVDDGGLIREYALRHGAARQVAQTLQGVFDAARQTRAGERSVRARFVPDQRTNTLLATATADQHAEVERLLLNLDADVDEQDDRPLAVIRLETAQPSSVVRTVREVLIGNDPARREKITISGDNQLGVLFVRAPEEVAQQVRDLVATVDQQGGADLPVRTIELTDADAGAVAQQLQRFFDDRARASTTPGQRPKTRRVSVTGDRRSGVLIVAADDEDFDLLRTLAASLDGAEEFGELEFRVLTLQHARAVELSPTLNDIADELQWLERWGGGRRNQDATDSGVVTVEADARTNAILLMGRGRALETMNSVVESLDRPKPEAAAVAVRVFKVERASLDVVRRAVERAFADARRSQRRWWEPPDPSELTIEADERTGAIIAVGPEAQLEEVGALIARLDESADAGAVLTVETIALQYADARSAAQSVSRFFRDRARLAGRDNAPVSVVGSRDGNALIVAAPEAELPLLRDIVAQLDRSDLAGDRSVEIVPLEFAAAADVARAIAQIFQTRGGPAERRVVVTPDSRTNSIVVASPDDLLPEVLGVARRLDEQGEGEVVQLRKFGLTTARADEVAATLDEALNLDRPAGGRARGLQEAVRKFRTASGDAIEVKAEITPDRRSNTLLVTADDASMEVIAGLIAELDDQPAVSPLVYKIIPLEHALAIDVAADLRSLVRSLPTEPGASAPSITSSDRDNTVIIAATADQLVEIESLLERLDQPAAGERITEFVPLRFADAVQVQEALGVFYGRFSLEAQTPGALNASIVADPSTNSLVISADKSEWPNIRELLNKLDSQEYDTARQLEVIALKHADARSVAQAIQRAFEAPLQAELERERQRQREEARRRGANRFDDFIDAPSVLVDAEEFVSVSAEPMTNSLIVSAGRNDLEKIKAIVQTIDVPDFANLPAPTILKVRAGRRASDLAASLRQMYEFSNAGGQGRSARSVSIVGDDVSGALVVRADDAQLAEIRALAETLQQEGELGRIGVRVLTLHRQPAARLAASMTRTFTAAAQERGERLAIETDRRANALVIASSVELFREIEQVVREIDGPAPAEGQGGLAPGPLGQGLFIIDVENLSPDEVRRQLEDLGVTRPAPDDRPGVVSEPVVLLPLSVRSSIAVLANPIDGPVITSLVRALDAAPAGALQEVALVRLSVASAAQVAQTLRAMLDPTSSDARTALADALAEQVRRLRMTGVGLDEPDLEIDLSQPIRIQPDGQTNAVVIASTPGNVAALSEMAAMLDRLPVGDAVMVRIFHLENASAERLSGVVQDLFSRGEALRRAPGTQLRGLPTTETGRALAGEIAVTVDERTNALVVAGREEAVALAEVLIAQLDADATANWIEPRLISLRFADAARVAETLREILIDGVGDTPEAAALRRQVGRLRVVRTGGELTPERLQTSEIFAPMTQLVIVPEEQLNAIIAVGSTSNVEVVEALIGQLDVEGASRTDRVRLYPLRHAAADRVAELLQDLFEQQVRSRSLRDEDSLNIQSDPRTNALIIATSNRSFTLVDSLIDTLDAAEAGPSTIGLHVLPAGANDASSLAPKLQSLMRDRLQALERGGATRDVVSIQADEATNQLIVACSVENLAIIQELMTLLAEGDPAAGDGIEVFTLESATAEDMVDLLEELYVDEVRRTRGDAALRVRADPRLNAVVVNGGPGDIERLRALVEQLDASSLMAVREIKVIPLKSANALEVVNLLRAVLSGESITGGRGTSRQATILRFVRDRAADDLEAELGAAPTETEVSSAIREQVTLTPDVRTNSVVVNAPPPMTVLIEALVNEFETSSGGLRDIEVFHLKNADAENMRALLQDLFNLQQQGQVYVLTPVPAPGSENDPNAVGDTTVTAVPDERRQLAITVDARTNTLLVSGTEEYLELVREVVEDLDQRQGAERVEFAFELKNARVEDVAGALQEFIDRRQDRLSEVLGPEASGSILRQLENEVSVVGVPGTSSLIVSTSPRYEDTIRGLIAELDKAPAQVKIRVLLAEVTLDTEDTWGLDLTIQPFGSRQYSGAYAAAGTGVATAVGLPNFSVASTDFELLVRALQVQGRLEVLSRPEVTVNDEEPAQINVGEEIQIVTGTTTLSDGRIQSIVEPREVGVILDVTPSISPDGFVRLDITPEISALTNRTTQISEDFEAPVISQRRAQTTVTVRDGQTIVIGGLIQTQENTRKTKVPLLGDIPLIGGVFRTELSSSVRTELLIILTPQVIINDTDLAGRNLDEITAEALNNLTTPETLLDLLPDQFGPSPIPGKIELVPAPTLQAPPSDPQGRRVDPAEVDGW